MSIQEPITLRPETIMIRELKRRIKDDVFSIRAHKVALRTLQHDPTDWHVGVAQSDLVRERGKARAKLLIYGVLRGKTWDQMEANHPWSSLLRIYLLAEWRSIQDYLQVETGSAAFLPPALQTILDATAPNKNPFYA